MADALEEREALLAPLSGADRQMRMPLSVSWAISLPGAAAQAAVTTMRSNGAWAASRACRRRPRR